MSTHSFSKTKIFVVLILASLFLLNCQKESEKEGAEKEIPQAVRNTFNQTYPDAVVKVYSEEIEDGNTFYEISFTWQGKKLDVLFNNDGKIVETEESTLAEDLPGKAREALDKEFDNYQIDLVEELKKEVGQFYEVKLTDRSSGKKYEIQFSQSGELVKKEEMKEEEK